MAIVAKKIQAAKVEAVKAIMADLSQSEDFIFTDYRSLTVEQLTTLRQQLRAKAARFTVVKNSYARIALKDLKRPDVSAYFVGPTAVVIAPQEANEVAKLLLNFSKEFPALKIKGGLIGQSIYGADQMIAFAKLPGRLELIAMLMSVMNGPVRNLCLGLNDINARLVRTVKAIADQKAESA